MEAPKGTSEPYSAIPVTEEECARWDKKAIMKALFDPIEYQK
ncbi:hypothetical protein ACJ73_09558 [Blastomyces percursus]|uniref:Uncharacterized protein n=1 Tax=Blastomyces percursus TaxID=1658174 RepID=A0A1J9P641_9EURO|nr:hypothetical protein ACJ73_09558 [Blastomyces percursus]